MRRPDPLDLDAPVVITDYRLPVFREVAETWPDRHLAMQYIQAAHAHDIALAGQRHEVHVRAPGPSGR